MTTPTPVYDKAYYRDYDNQRYERNEEWLALFNHFADRIVTTLAPSRVLDAGCAFGMLVEALVGRGVDSYGIDISEFAIGQVPEPLVDRCKVQSLTEPIEGRYDLITCIEVIEHLPAAEVHDAVKNLCAAATDAILFSSTPTEHEEPTHLNVQPPEYWSALFAANGFLRDTDYDATYISPWAVLYRRRPIELTEVVRGYDRAWWRLRDENQRIRSALIETTAERDSLGTILTDAEWDDVRAHNDPAEALRSLSSRIREDRSENGRVRELQEQLTEETHRRLVMQDELIGAQRRAGELAGRLAELESELVAHHSLRGRCEEAETKYREVVESTTWRLAWKLLAPYRRLRGIANPPSN